MGRGGGGADGADIDGSGGGGSERGANYRKCSVTMTAAVTSNESGAGRRMRRHGRGLPLLLLLASWAVAVEEVKFADLDPKTPGQVVLFYRKGEAASDAAAAALAAAQPLVAERAGEKATGVVFKQCDAAQKENKVGMEARGLSSSLPMLFVAVEGQGTGARGTACPPPRAAPRRAPCLPPPPSLEPCANFPARPDAVRRACRSLYAQYDGR